MCGCWLGVKQRYSSLLPRKGEADIRAWGIGRCVHLCRYLTLCSWWVWEVVLPVLAASKCFQPCKAIAFGGSCQKAGFDPATSLLHYKHIYYICHQKGAAFSADICLHLHTAGAATSWVTNHLITTLLSFLITSALTVEPAPPLPNAHTFCKPPSHSDGFFWWEVVCLQVVVFLLFWKRNSHPLPSSVSTSAFSWSSIKTQRPTDSSPLFIWEHFLSENSFPLYLWSQVENCVRREATWRGIDWGGMKKTLKNNKGGWKFGKFCLWLLDWPVYETFRKFWIKPHGWITFVVEFWLSFYSNASLKVRLCKEVILSKETNRLILWFVWRLELTEESLRS